MIGESEQAANQRRRDHDARLTAWRIENRRRQGLPPLWTMPALASAVVLPASPPNAPAARAVPAAPTALDIEFEKVRAAALARQEAERQARADEDAAVTAILGAVARTRA